MKVKGEIYWKKGENIERIRYKNIEMIYDMAKFTQEEINNIIGLKGHDGRQIDIFKLHGVLFIGNTEDGEWDLNKNYMKMSEHYIPITLDDFEDCETEDEVENTFREELEEMIINKLL